MRAGRALVLFACAALCACDTTRTETLSSGLELRYLPGCAPERLDAVTVEALGDFPSGERTFASVDPRAGESVLGALPVDARLFRVRVESPGFTGMAIGRAADDGSLLTALVLPLGRSCELLDTLPQLSGAAVAQLSGGDLLIAGGASGLAARADAYRLRVAEGRLVRDREGLFVARARAAGVRVADEAWIVGGAQSLGDGSPALDSFERYDASSGEFVGLGRLESPRLDAAAVALLDGSVLVIGGHSRVGGAALDSIERVPAGSTEGERLAQRLPFGVSAPELVVRDDGLVVVQAGAPERPSLLVLDPSSGAGEELALPRANFERSPMVALPGARVAWVELRRGETTGALIVQLPDLRYVRLDEWLTSFAAFSEPRVAALSDGRLLLAGKLRGRPAARIIDPGRGKVSVRALEREVARLVAREDGSVVELGAESAGISREDARTLYDNPGGTLLADDADAIALDAHTRWQREGLELSALVAGARFDLAGLRYADVRIELDVRGDGELLVRGTGGEERVIAVSRAEVGPAFCTIARGTGIVRITRRGDEFTIRTAGDPRTCRLEGLDGPVTFAVRALAEGLRVRSLVITRE